MVIPANRAHADSLNLRSLECGLFAVDVNVYLVGLLIVHADGDDVILSRSIDLQHAMMIEMADTGREQPTCFQPFDAR